MNPPIGTRIVVRTVVDWNGLNAESFVDQDDDGRPLEHIRFVADNDGLGLWADTFDIDYFEFRSELRAIAESNLRSVVDADVSFGLDDMSWFADADDYVFPIDDDDLFHPELAAGASAAAAGRPLAMWPAAQLINDDSGVSEFRGLPLTSFATNNGGIRSAFLREHFTTEEARTIMLFHRRATTELARVLQIEPPGGSVHEMFTDFRGPHTFFSRERLSVSIKHPGSLTQIGAALRSDDPAGYLRRAALQAPREIPEAFAWTEPWVRQIGDLLRG